MLQDVHNTNAMFSDKCIHKSMCPAATAWYKRWMTWMSMFSDRCVNVSLHPCQISEASRLCKKALQVVGFRSFGGCNSRVLLLTHAIHDSRRKVH